MIPIRELRKVGTIIDLGMTVMRHTSDQLPDTWEQAGLLSIPMIIFQGVPVIAMSNSGPTLNRSVPGCVYPEDQKSEDIQNSERDLECDF